MSFTDRYTASVLPEEIRIVDVFKTPKVGCGLDSPQYGQTGSSSFLKRRLHRLQNIPLFAYPAAIRGRFVFSTALRSPRLFKVTSINPSAALERALSLR